jgi:hypothetical protein
MKQDAMVAAALAEIVMAGLDPAILAARDDDNRGSEGFSQPARTR